MDARGPYMSFVMTGLQRKQALQSTLNCYMLWQSTKYKELPCRMCFQCENTNTIKVKLENHMKFHISRKNIQLQTQNANIKWFFSIIRGLTQEKSRVAVNKVSNQSQ